VEPRLGTPSFTCPHCGTLAYQAWFRIHLELLDANNAPGFPDTDTLQKLEADATLREAEKASLREHYARIQSRALFISAGQAVDGLHLLLPNLNINRCFGCSNVSVWLADHLVEPRPRAELQAAPETPEDVGVAFDEAAKVVDASPPAAAALLRLAIQKLIMVLGGSGKNLSADVATLGKKGLDVRIQRALESLRVIGSDAAQPGHIDMRDDRASAMRLFQLVNLMVNTMITQPRLVDAVLSGADSLKRAALVRVHGE
jgi:hypothetical protein